MNMDENVDLVSYICNGSSTSNPLHDVFFDGSEFDSSHISSLEKLPEDWMDDGSTNDLLNENFNLGISRLSLGYIPIDFINL